MQSYYGFIFGIYICNAFEFSGEIQKYFKPINID